MKLTASAAIAVAATGAAAQDSWSAWASTSTSSKPVSKTTCAVPTVIKTETTTAYQVTSEVYQKTVTVPIPDKPATVSIKSDWVDWQKAASTSTSTSTVTSDWADWQKATSTSSTSTVCDEKKTVTSTSTYTSTVPGTTTITKSILFIGAKVTDTPDAAWNNWPSADKPSSPSSVGGSVAGSSSGSWSGSSWTSGDDGSDSDGVSSGSVSGGWGGRPSSSDNDGSNGNKGWGQGSWGGSGTGGLSLGSGNDVFHWEAPEPSNTASGIAPSYTKKPDGTYGGTPWGGVGGWGNWDGEDGDGSSSGGSKGGKGNSTDPTDGSKNNGTQTTNGTIPDFGSPSSNLTKPFAPLKGGDLYNSASDRSKWFGGLSTDTDYYKNYFGECSDAGIKAQPFAHGGPQGKTCSYDLTLTRGKWNADGTEVDMMLINGQYPGPAIECNWGDLVQITVHNQVDKNGTAIHWHGIRQICTNDQDGVPGVTECALAPGKSKTYTWRASSYGTSWYHSHWNLQYADGIEGPIIIHGPATANYDVDAGPVMISDTFGMAGTAFGSLIAHRGPLPVDNYLLNGKNTKTDLSAGQHSLWEVEKGKKYLFRFINSAAQNMYSVSIDGHKMTVIAADFVPIEPYSTAWLNIGIGQRYDVVVEMNQAVDSYFLRAVTQTACPSASKNSGLGQANGVIHYSGASYLLPTSTLNGNRTAASFRVCEDEPIASLVPHLKKTAGTKSAFDASVSTIAGGTVGLVQTSDDGGVFRWLLNGGAMYVNYTEPTIKSIANGVNITDNSTIYANHITLNQKDQWVYFVIQNQFFAAHPMHLHGHDFSILGQGDGLFTASMASTLNFDNPIRRDTAMLKGANPGATSGGYTVIGFETDNPGAWLMHCHIAWHVDGGLALQWIERPDDMKASPYTDEAAFKGECDDYAAYEAEDPSHKKFSGQSGLKKREPTFFDQMVDEINRQFNNVVRRDESAAHHYLESHLKRGLGDGGNRRTFGRRR